MPRKPTYSPSKLTTYLACPHKYYWTYLNPRGRWFVRSRSEFSFGQSLHRVLEMFHGSNDQGVETVEQALAALDENWVEAGFGSAEEMAEAYGEGKAIIERYVDEHRVPKVGAQTIAVEKALRADLGEFVLVGRVDRLDRLDDGTLEVVDYKTQRTAVSPEDVDSSIAMGCYQLLLSKLHPGVPVRATLVAVRSGAEASSSMNAEALQEFEFALRELVRTIDCHEWPEMPPRPKALCEECDFLKLCQKHPEYAQEVA